MRIKSYFFSKYVSVSNLYFFRDWLVCSGRCAKKFEAYQLPLDVCLMLEKLFHRLISCFEESWNRTARSYICTDSHFDDPTVNSLLAHRSKWTSFVKPYSIPNESEIERHPIKSEYFNRGAEKCWILSNEIIYHLDKHLVNFLTWLIPWTWLNDFLKHKHTLSSKSVSIIFFFEQSHGREVGGYLFALNICCPLHTTVWKAKKKTKKHEELRYSLLYFNIKTKLGDIQLYLDNVTQHSVKAFLVSLILNRTHKEAVSDPVTPSTEKRRWVGLVYRRWLDPGQRLAITFWPEITYFLITYGLRLC